MKSTEDALTVTNSLTIRIMRIFISKNKHLLQSIYCGDLMQSHFYEAFYSSYELNDAFKQFEKKPSGHIIW